MVDAKQLLEYSKSLNILYVEDEKDLRESLFRSLSKLFNTAFVAQNGKEALELYKQNSIDIVLTDINMPMMNGVELIQALKNEKEIPEIIVLTAHNDINLLIQLIDLNIDAFINKPVEKEKLIQTLYKTCTKRFEHKMIISYQEDLHKSYLSLQKNHRVLKRKLDQIAHEKNVEKREPETLNTIDSDYFENILQEDRDELQDLTQELEGYIYLLNNSTIDDNHLEKLSILLNSYARILNSYSEFSDISSSLNELGDDLLTCKAFIKQHRENTALLFESFELTLINFKESIWDKKTDKPRFYNASLISDIEQISSFIQNKINDNVIDFF